MHADCGQIEMKFNWMIWLRPIRMHDAHSKRHCDGISKSQRLCWWPVWRRCNIVCWRHTFLPLCCIILLFPLVRTNLGLEVPGLVLGRIYKIYQKFIFFLVSLSVLIARVCKVDCFLAIVRLVSLSHCVCESAKFNFNLNVKHWLEFQLKIHFPYRFLSMNLRVFVMANVIVLNCLRLDRQCSNKTSILAGFHEDIYWNVPSKLNIRQMEIRSILEPYA